MSPKRVFESMTDEQMSEMCLALIAGVITREDYHRLCCWLDEGIRLCDYPNGDSTIELLKSLQGRVTRTQVYLLKEAMGKWIGVIQTFILDSDNNAHKVATNPIQRSLALESGGRQMIPVIQKGYGNTPVSYGGEL